MEPANEVNESTRAISQQSARRAALLAAQHFEQAASNKRSKTSRAAVYTWGFLALMGLSVGAGLGVGLSFDGPQVATKPVPAAENTVAALENPPEEQVAETTLEEWDAADDLFEDTQPEVAASEPDVDQKEELAQSAGIDPMTTGAVSKPAPAVVPSVKLGARVGDPASVDAVASRYSAFDRRIPGLFNALVPLVHVERDNRANLIAGPFDSTETVSQFCRTIMLQLTVGCTVSPYKGTQLISRQ